MVLRKLFVCLLILALTCSRLWAGAGPGRQQIDKLEKKVAACLEHHRRVTIETYDDRLLQGFVSEAAADAFLLSHNGKSTTLHYADVKKIKWTSEVSKQVKVVLGTAAVVGVILGSLVLLGGLRG